MKKNNIRLLRIRPWILFLFCLFLYPPTLKAFPALTNILTIGVPVVYLMMNRNLLHSINTRQSRIFLGIILMIILSVLVPFLKDTNDYSYLYITTYFFRKLLVYLFIICLIIKKHGSEKAFYYLMYYFSLVHLIFVLGTLLLVLLPSAQNVWFSIFKKEASSSALLTSFGYTFRFGWQGFAGFRLTLYCTLGAIFSLYLGFGTKPRVINTRQFLMTFLGCVVGNMFYGRSGLLVTLIVTLIAVVYWNRKNLKRLLAFIGIAIIFVLSVGLLKDVPVFSDWYVWMSRPILNLLSTGDFDNQSFDTLRTMSQIEIPPETVVFGDGKYTDDGHYYMTTDVGYMRNVFFWGLFGVIISYGLTLYSIFHLREISKLLVLQFLIVFVIFEYKGAVYYEFIPLLFSIDFAFMLAEAKPGKEEHVVLEEPKDDERSLSLCATKYLS